jgi:hypothetical protein
MIASQKIGKSFMGALNYNLKKLNHPDKNQRAELLDTNFTSLAVAQIKREVELLRELRPNLNRYVYHTSLNFSKLEDKSLSNEKLLAIAHDYLHASGYTNNQYFIFRHYDADHPHIHLLVNRIGFDGNVVSDSNNYKRSEAILRKLEYQYNLISVEPSNHRTMEQSNHVSVDQSNAISVEQYNDISVEQYNDISIEQDNDVSIKQYNGVSVEQYNYISQRAPTKDELEMVIRTGKPSGKMLLQELMKKLLSQKNLSIQDLIKKGEQAGIHFLFNQASTGRISGITYFHNDFKIKGQALGNQFKWAELLKKVNYEQVRDSEAINEANHRTKAKYGDKTAIPGQPGIDSGQFEQRGSGLFANAAPDSFDDGGKPADVNKDDRSAQFVGETATATGEKTDIVVDASADYSHDSLRGTIRVEISDDQDDAKRRRKKRGR